MSLFRWNRWLRDAWADLESGKQIDVPAALARPASVGFREGDVAEPAGQCRDWILSLEDGSRLHVHEYKTGLMRLHRDRWDPDRSLGHLAKHMLFETTGGQIAVAGFFVFLFIKAVQTA